MEPTVLARLSLEPCDWNSLWRCTDRPRRTPLVPYPFERHAEDAVRSRSAITASRCPGC